jgi:hypothetical protein
MSTDYHPVRIETLMALALSKRWPRDDSNVVAAEGIGTEAEQESDSGQNDIEENQPESSGGLPFVLRGLNTPDRHAAEALLRRFEKLSPADQSRWLASKLGRIRASTPEKNRRFEKDIDPSQITDALRHESLRIQTLIVSMLPSSQAEPVAEALGLSSAIDADTLPSIDQPTVIKLVDFVRQAFFAQFVSTTALNNPTPLDLLSGVELARLIRILGVRETAIACKGISAVETVTAFLKRFSAEDAHAIVFHLTALKAVESERIAFAETIARKALNQESEVASTMLDRVGLALLAIVLDTFGALRRRHTTQKLPLAAARELDELLNGTQTYSDHEMAHRIVAEAQSLAENLHRLPLEADEERRGAPLI